MVGNDLHLTAIVGAKQLKDEGAEYDIEAGWVDHTPKPPKSRNIGAPLPKVFSIATGSTQERMSHFECTHMNSMQETPKETFNPTDHAGFKMSGGLHSLCGTVWL